MKTLTVEKKDEGKKLITFLSNEFPSLNINYIYKALRKKDVKINGKRINQNVVLHFSDIVDLYISDDILYGIKKMTIPIIYEDDNIVIFNKPSNLEVTGENSLTSIMKENYTFLEPCHRIDRNTKGIVLFAKNQQALEILLDKFKNKEIEKHYLAKVYGIPKNKTSILEAYLFKDSKKSLVYISDIPKKDYVKIVTEYTLISSDLKTNTSILDINLHTGKTHQIRAHLSHIGLPILGDGKYGINDINKKFSKKTQELYSYKLIFKFSPSSGILNYLSNKEFSIPINLK